MATNLTKKEKGFAKDYMDTGNGVQSALKNYDTESYFSAGAIASQNLKKLQIQQYIAEHAEDAESMIYKLSQQAKSEMVRYVSSKDIMDRAGHKPVEKTQSTSLNVNIERKVENTELELIRKEFEEKLRAKLTS